MSLTSSGGSIADAPTTEAFADLVCDDVELLRAEFDAIVAAAWPDRPTPRPGRPCGGDGGRCRRAVACRWGVARPASAPATRVPGRERSPPRGPRSGDDV